MADPAIGDSVLGVKFASVIAGFAGGVVSLSFVKQLTAAQAVLAVFTGTVTANYGTPIVLHYISGISPELHNGIAFCLGLTAMNIVPGLIKLSDIFRRDPRSFVGGGK